MHYLKKNTVLKTISYINGISFCYFGSWLDADSYIPLIIVCVNILWFVLFGYANNWFEGWCD